jgi:hypothetical protein
MISKLVTLTIVALCAACSNSRHIDISGRGEKPSDLPPFQDRDTIQLGKDKRIPYGVSDYWLKVLTLIKLHDGFIEASELHDAFDAAALIRVKNFDDSGYRAFLVGNEYWFGGFSYVRLWKHSSVYGKSMDVSDDDFSSLSMPGVLDAHKECLDPIKAKGDLEALGWKKVPFVDPIARISNNGPPPENFGVPAPIKMVKRDGRSTVVIVYDDPAWRAYLPNHACVAGIDVEGYR